MYSISIVMPCHNRAHDLCHVLKAYDEQTLFDGALSLEKQIN